MDVVTLALAKSYTDKEIAESGIHGLQIIIVQTLPTTGLANTMYLVPRSGSTPPDIYDEFIYTNNAWERIGSTQIDLTDYWNTDKAESEVWTFTLADGTTVSKKVLIDVRSE